MKEQFNYYRIKLSFLAEAEDGALVQAKTEDLAMATCYAEAEKIAYKLMEGNDQLGDVKYEVLKSKVTNILFNDTLKKSNSLTCGLMTLYFDEPADTEVGLYNVSAIITAIKANGKANHQKETIYIPATSPKEAIKYASTYLEQNFKDAESYTIRNVKYDMAQSIMITPETYKTYTNQ